VLDSADHYLACYRVTFCHFSRGAVDVSCDFVVRRGKQLGSIRTARYQSILYTSFVEVFIVLYSW
jgi:hypothetical protein